MKPKDKKIFFSEFLSRNVCLATDDEVDFNIL